MADEKRCIVHKNENGAEGKVVVVPNNMAKFKKVAGKKLGVKAKKLYLASGAEITELDQIQNDDMIYVSAGEAFYKNQTSGSGTETLHLSVLGTGGVGKSAVTLRFVRDFFVKDWDPTIEDAYVKTVDCDGSLSRLEILDTAGQDDFESLRPQWMMEKDGYIFCFDLTQENSLAELQPFYELHQELNEDRNVSIILLGNKKDLVTENPSSRKITTEVAKAKADEWGAVYLETSAYSGENINESFNTFIREVRKFKVPKKESSGWSCNIL